MDAHGHQTVFALVDDGEVGEAVHAVEPDARPGADELSPRRRLPPGVTRQRCLQETKVLGAVIGHDEQSISLVVNAVLDALAALGDQQQR